MERREAPIMPRFAKRDARLAIDALRPAALHSNVLRRPGRAFGGFLPFLEPSDLDPLSEHRGLSGLGKAGALAVSELLAAGPCACGRGPGAARALGVRIPKPAGTAPDPII
jgi:hypothetical protein